MNSVSERKKGIVALVIMAFLGTLMGVWVRCLGEHFELYQQVSIRAFSGFLIGILIYWKYLRIRRIKEIPGKDLYLIILRSIVLIVGIGLYSFSVMSTKFANVSFIFALPTTAFFGIVLLKEKIDFKKVLLLLFGFIGVSLISINMNNLQEFSFGKGEILAFISTFFYSFSYIIRKWLSPHLNNHEIALSGSFFSFVFAFILSQVFGNGIGKFITISLPLIVVVLLAGLTFISLGYFANYGFERVEAITANNILILGSVFGLLIGFLVYKEIPVMREIIGGVILIVSAYGMNLVDNVLD